MHAPADGGRQLLASVWDHRHNYLARLDLGAHSQAILYESGDFDKIIVGLVQVADKVVICDRDRRAKVFVGSVKVHDIAHPCFFQRRLWSSALEYYAMSKVFAKAGDKIFFVSGDNRGKVVQVDLNAEGYPETYIVFPQMDLFQVVFDGHSLLAGIGEESGILAFYDLYRGQIVKTIELNKGKLLLRDYIYRTVDSNSGITIVNGVKNSGFETENELTLIDRDFEPVARHRITFEGGNLGKYIHKIKIEFLENSGLPVIGLISHHHEDANFYLLGIDSSKKFVPVASIEKLHHSKVF